MEPKRLNSAEIKKIVSSVHSLDQHQKELMRDLLAGFAHSGDGKVSTDELHRELYKLRQAGEISEFDAKSIEGAVFSE
jgi:hypothetical protein